MSYNYAIGHHLLPVPMHLATFEGIAKLMNEFYVVSDMHASRSGYSICPELAPNGKVNTRV